MKNEAIAEANRILQQRRLVGQVELNNRLEEISLKVPAVMDVRRRLAQTSVEVSKLVLSRVTDVQTAIQKIQDNNLALQAEEKRLLREAGYPEDYLVLHYTCPRCKDTGYLDGVRCRCMENLIRQYNLDRLNQVSSLRLTGFDDFDLSYYPATTIDSVGKSIREWMTQVLAYCRNYAEKFTPESGSILMLGATGLGKSHLSLAIASAVIGRGYGVVYGSAQDFLRKIEQEHFRPEKNGEDTLDGLLQADLLILDDLGAEFSTQFTKAAINNIISARLSREKPTIISTNLNRAEMEERYTERVVSRVFTQYLCLKFLGKDIRQLKRERRSGEIQ